MKFDFDFELARNDAEYINKIIYYAMHDKSVIKNLKINTKFKKYCNDYEPISSIEVSVNQASFIMDISYKVINKVLYVSKIKYILSEISTQALIQELERRTEGEA